MKDEPTIGLSRAELNHDRQLQAFQKNQFTTSAHFLFANMQMGAYYQVEK